MIIVLFALLVSCSATADELRPGYLEFTQRTGTTWSLVWKAPRGTGMTLRVQPQLPPVCAIVGSPDIQHDLVSVVTRMDITCAKPVTGLQIGLSNLDTAQTDVLARIQPLGRPVQAYRLTPTAPSAEILAKPSYGQVARTYFVTGVEHIIFGYDHLLFVVALVLLLSGYWTIAKAVTAFTVAHSLTLIGTTLGFFGLPQRPVEAVIALSIMFLAVEIVKKVPGEPRLSERIPWVVAFGFGLLHGFGFAGALNEIGLPESDVPTALLTFNLGVEAGQVIIVIVTFAFVALLKRHATALTHPALRASAYAIGTVSAFWFIERL